MNIKEIKVTNAVVSIAETKDDNSLEMQTRICYYGKPNSNKAVLPVDTAEKFANTLLEMPVVAKYRRYKGADDLGGHEVTQDAKGNTVFGTIPIGVHTAVEVKNDDVEIDGETYNLPCLFATSKIWKRNTNIVNAIQRLFGEHRLFNSWEIAINKYHKDAEGNKIVTDYSFLGDCLLGTTKEPSYGSCATTLAIAENNIADELSEAIYLDNIIPNSKKEEGEIVDKDILTNTEVEETVNVAETAEVTDVADTTPQENVADEIETTDVSEKFVTVRQEATDRISTEVYDTETETVETTETLVVSNQTISGKVDTEVTSDAQSEQIEERNQLILTMSKEIEGLKAECASLKETISSLEHYKEVAEAYEKAKAEQELAEKRDALKTYVISSGYITSDECETSEAIKTMIAELDKSGLDNEIVNRVILGRKHEQTDGKVTVAETIINNDEVSNASVNLNCTDDCNALTSQTIMRMYLNK